jgi:hypothetical protein
MRTAVGIDVPLQVTCQGRRGATVVRGFNTLAEIGVSASERSDPASRLDDPGQVFDPL